MMTATINRWCYAFDDDRSPPVIKQRTKPLEEPAVPVPPNTHHCAYCLTPVDHKANSYQVCDDEKCRKKHERDKNTQRLDRAHQQAGGGIVQRGKNRQ